VWNLNPGSAKSYTEYCYKRFTAVSKSAQIAVETWWYTQKLDPDNSLHTSGGNLPRNQRVNWNVCFGSWCKITTCCGTNLVRARSQVAIANSHRVSSSAIRVSKKIVRTKQAAGVAGQ